MTMRLASEATDSMTLAAFVEHCEREIGVVDVETLAQAAPAFKRLMNNARVVTDFIDAELRGWRAGRNDHEYVGRTLVLARRPHFLIRANVWVAPDPRRPAPTADDPGFGYLTPHDHNFAFLTGAYSGPGYRTVLFEYDANDVTGIPGERVDLQERGRVAFPRGEMMLYEPSKDVHFQDHPDALSITLNVVVAGRYTERAQYLFDVADGTITASLTASAARGTTLCDLAAEVGDDRTAELLADVARGDGNGRVRVAAAAALTSLQPAAGTEMLDRLRADRDPGVRRLAAATPPSG